MEPRISIITLGVDDRKAAAEFYGGRVTCRSRRLAEGEWE